MGIFDGIFGGEPRASSGASALFDARSAFHAASAAGGFRSGGGDLPTQSLGDDTLLKNPL